MSKLFANYLNVGCGDKYHPEWTNVDMSATSPHVIAANLLQGFPFAGNSFAVVYHSQVLEHIPKNHAAGFIAECFRVLQPGGILRVVVPDLENIVTEYLHLLQANLSAPTAASRANYDWIMMELYDQTVRNRSGGEMAAMLTTPVMANEAYVLNRIGHVGRQYRKRLVATAPMAPAKSGLAQKVINRAKKLYKSLLPAPSEAESIGRFRLGGEIHYWMYDRYSLGRLLLEAGFENPVVMQPHQSDIPGWANFELDVKNGLVYDPTSLFMEAKKPGGKA